MKCIGIEISRNCFDIYLYIYIYILRLSIRSSSEILMTWRRLTILVLILKLTNCCFTSRMNFHSGWDKHLTSKEVFFGFVDVRRISICCFQIVSITKVHMKTHPLPNSCRILFSRTLLFLLHCFYVVKPDL